MAQDHGGSRTRLRRQPQRGRYDAATIHAILDEGFVCHMGVAGDQGPVVLPMAYGRRGDTLYLHGAVGNAALRALPVCVTVTLVDGLVLSRSAFHHSMNYRSVVIFGAASEVTDPTEKRRALAAVVDHMIPGRSAAARPPTDSELRATRVVRMPLGEASAKIRTGGPVEEPGDTELPVWSGQIPLSVVAGEPIADGVPACAAPLLARQPVTSKRAEPLPLPEGLRVRTQEIQ